MWQRHFQSALWESNLLTVYGSQNMKRIYKKEEK